MPTILVVDDDQLMRRSLALSLQDAGYEVRTAGSGEEALANVEGERPDLVLLDIGLPGIDGLEALRRIKAQLSSPVIFVTARRRELDEIVGLELGADDYVTKPFDMDVLLARIKAVLRRVGQTERVPDSEAKSVAVGGIHVDPAAREVTVDGEQVALSPKEFDMLTYLAQRAGEAVSIDEILSHVWGDEWVGETQTVYVHARWLREKIEREPNQPNRLLTVRGVGYKLVSA